LKLGAKTHLITLFSFQGSSVASKGLPAGKFYPLINAAEARLPTAPAADA